METHPALRALCVTGEFPSHRPVTRSFGVFFDLRLNRRLSKQPRRWWFETSACSLWRHCNDLLTRILNSGFCSLGSTVASKSAAMLEKFCSFTWVITDIFFEYSRHFNPPGWVMTSPWWRRPCFICTQIISGVSNVELDLIAKRLCILLLCTVILYVLIIAIASALRL